jgi:N-carbamoyl-L-amino-acid hydrolase
VGVLGAIEAVRCLRETGTRLTHELRVVDFLGEEPNLHGSSCVGSRALAGLLTPEMLGAPDSTGRALGDTMRAYGLDPAAALRAGWDPAGVHAFVELHVEQGPVLERESVEIGVVTAIAGIERMVAAFVGRPDHAGTASMADRRDALAAAAEAVLTVEQVGCGGGPGAVATTGRIAVEPNAVNVVPGRVTVSSEVRSVDPGFLRRARCDLTERIVAGARARGVEVELDWLADQDPVPASGGVPEVIASVAAGLGRTWRALPSGAGHDAAHMARLAPMGMVFVPSRAGRSHCPEEFTELPHIAAGVQVLAGTLVALDAR